MSTPKQEWHIGPGPAAPKPSLHYSNYGRSTSLTVSGVFLLIVAGVCSTLGSQAQLSAATSLYGSRNAGEGFLVVAAVTALIGLITLLVGIAQLTKNIDLTAQYVAETMRREEEKAGRRASSSVRSAEPAAVTGETRRARRPEAGE